MIKKILVPLDGSDLAERALVLAEEWDKALGESTVLLMAIKTWGIRDCHIAGLSVHAGSMRG